MDSSFTREEKRFVLAEILKASDVSVENLWQFIQANQIAPNWMNMQVPWGRSLSQCIQVVGHIADTPTQRGSLPAGRTGGFNPKQQPEHASEDIINPRLNKISPSKTSTAIVTLPRSPGDHGQGLATSFLPGHNHPKKRGRPSRADRAKKNLYPNLPPHLTLRSLSTTGYRPILPAELLKNGDSAQPGVQDLSPNISESPGVEREKKRRRLDDGTAVRQANSPAIKIKMAPAVSSGAI